MPTMQEQLWATYFIPPIHGLHPFGAVVTSLQRSTFAGKFVPDIFNRIYPIFVLQSCHFVDVHGSTNAASAWMRMSGQVGLITKTLNKNPMTFVMGFYYLRAWQ